MTRGIILKITATLIFTLMAVLIKLTGGRFELGEIAFFRAFFALAVIAIWVFWQGNARQTLKTQRVPGHILRGSIGSLGMYCNFAALGLLPLPTATAISFAAPLITVALAALVLKERVHLYRWSAVAVGFVGVLIMVGSSAFDGGRTLSGPIIGLLGAFFTASAVIQTRRLTSTDGTSTVVFYFMLSLTCVSTLMLIVAAHWPPGLVGAKFMEQQRFLLPDWRDGLLLAGIGICGGLGQIFMTESYQHADASIIASFDYSSMVWALVLGYGIFDEIASFYVLLGALIVVCAGVFVIWRERKLGLSGAQSSKVV
ncbi:MAG: DMT family transporter [Hyphomicrobiales bacterium]|nr:DMT family transporter [Hyphomicrobiales bacterium]MDE2114316.1 DMT family transporter [Hyphomicrobiales bacterium]